MELRPLELLSPAKNKACAIAAIEYGADAIYVGASAFGARKNAANGLEDIKEIVNFAHKFFVRVYVALNTILNDQELKDVQKLLYELYDIGVDGIIVQDFGIFTLDLPPFFISASTQCDIRDFDKVKFFENLGLDRVILAREMSVCKINEIAKATNIEIETFIHGALCVSYSGQCYLSCALGSRSANRGECAQPCRKKYTLCNKKGKIYAKDKYLLSLKDFCAAPYLDDLINSGVSSFKIEGRLKDENYVKNVTAYYNLLLQNKKRASSGRVEYDFIPDINKTFNRGYSDYFLCADNPDTQCDRDIFNFDTPKRIGEEIGTATRVLKYFFEIKLNDVEISVNAQDGLCYIIDGTLEGMLINKTEIVSDCIRVYPNKMPKITPGTVMYRNFDYEFDKKLKNSKTKRQIGLDLKIYRNKLEALDEDGIKLCIQIEGDEIAKNPETAKNTYVQQLKKCGGTDFRVNDIEFCSDNLMFLKVAQINALRRELFEKLMQKRIDTYEKTRRARCAKKITPVKFPLKNNDYRLNVHNKGARMFYESCGVRCKQASFESNSGNIKDAELMRTKHCLRRAFGMCAKTPAGKSGISADEKLFLIDEKGKKLALFFDCKNCEMIIKEK